MKKVLLGLLLVISLSAQAKDCEKGADNMGMVWDCLVTQSREPVKSAYDELIKALGNKKEAIASINDAQNSWETFRDSTCDYVIETDNGNIDPREVIASCLIDFNTARVKMLKKYIKEAR